MVSICTAARSSSWRTYHILLVQLMVACCSHDAQSTCELFRELGCVLAADRHCACSHARRWVMAMVRRMLENYWWMQQLVRWSKKLESRSYSQSGSGLDEVFCRLKALRSSRCVCGSLCTRPAGTLASTCDRWWLNAVVYGSCVRRSMAPKCDNA